MDCLVRFCQFHEQFRIPELEALAVLHGIDLEILDYRHESPFCLIKVPSEADAILLASRSILVQSIHELWGVSSTGLLEDLHTSVRERAAPILPAYEYASFKFMVDVFMHTRSQKERVSLMESFGFLPMKGTIELKNPDVILTIFEEWPFVPEVKLQQKIPNKAFLGRWLGNGSRDLCWTYDLKKRGYISTTSMDAELALVTANIVHAAPGKIIYDPFVGTGSFPIAAAHYGALAFGSDIDGRSFRGKGGKKSLKGNFEQYNLKAGFGEFFTADLTNTPLVTRRWMDGILCDPPYGVREGLKVLGARDPEKRPSVNVAAELYSKSENYIPPKKPYSFLAMLDDILQFTYDMVVDNGRLSFWMPTANDEEKELPIPQHPGLEFVSVAVQPFYKWSRRLLTYRRLPDAEVDKEKLAAWKRTQQSGGTTADELNPFRERYFKGFKRGMEGTEGGE